ncbi:MAG: DUF3850 domain-containing protein [Desulfobacteraceae bacterium]|nr:DUF3850 domain-containing protein [Desulfobacteraceae bacterium]
MINAVIDWLLECFGDEIRTIHELKTWPANFEPLLAKTKRAEVRRNDRDFQTGDWLLLREWDPATQTYTGRQAFREITHIQPGGAFGLPEDLCVLSVA